MISTGSWYVWGTVSVTGTVCRWPRVVGITGPIFQKEIQTHGGTWLVPGDPAGRWQDLNPGLSGSLCVYLLPSLPTSHNHLHSQESMALRGLGTW